MCNELRGDNKFFPHQKIFRYKRKSVVGYKVFRVDNDSLIARFNLSVYCELKNCTKPIKWRDSLYKGKGGEIGFAFFRRKKDAMLCYGAGTVVKVLCEDLIGGFETAEIFGGSLMTQVGLCRKFTILEPEKLTW